jgi:hypothetical protein
MSDYDCGFVFCCFYLYTVYCRVLLFYMSRAFCSYGRVATGSWFLVKVKVKVPKMNFSTGPPSSIVVLLKKSIIYYINYDICSYVYVLAIALVI